MHVRTVAGSRRGGDERKRGVGAIGEEVVLADGSLDALDGVEVAVFADERRAERGNEPTAITACAEVRGDELSGRIDLLLAVEQARELLQQRSRVRA